MRPSRRSLETRVGELESDHSRDVSLEELLVGNLQRLYGDEDDVDPDVLEELERCDGPDGTDVDVDPEARDRLEDVELDNRFRE